MEDLLIFPFGGNARESLLAIEALNRISLRWNVLGFVDDNAEYWGRECCGFKVLGGREIFTDFPDAKILAVPGKPENFSKRDRIIDLIAVPESRFASIVDPSARIAPNAKLGINTLLMANVVISCSVELGDHCVVLPNTVISHDCFIDRYTLIGSNTSISGSCSIGANCYIGSGTRIKDHVSIGRRCLIGLGSCVIRNVPDNTVVAGNPARYLRKTEDDITTCRL